MLDCATLPLLLVMVALTLLAALLTLTGLLALTSLLDHLLQLGLGIVDRLLDLLRVGFGGCNAIERGF